MQLSDDLFQLIHSLNQGEKWNFRAYTRGRAQGRQKKYLQLFDAIARQSTYDEAALKRKFRKEGFVKQFSVAKNYLYNLILESLETYDPKNTPDRQAKRLMVQIEVLYKKGLWAQARKLLRKVQKIVAQYELSMIGLEAQLWEYKIADVPKSINRSRKLLNRTYQEEKKRLQNYTAARDYSFLKLYYHLQIAQQGNPRGKAAFKKFDPIFNHPLMQEGRHTHSALATYSYHSLKAYQLMNKGDNEGAYKAFKKTIDLLEQQEEKFSAQFNSFVSAYIGELYIFLAVAAHLRRFDDYFEKKIEALRNMPLNYPKLSFTLQDRARMYRCYYIIRFRQYISTANFEEGKRLLPQMEEQLTEGQFPQAKKAAFYMAGLFSFYAGEFQASLHWFSNWQNQPSPSAYQEVYSWVRVFSIISHFELGNYRHLEYLIKSTYRYWLKIARLGPYERLLLQFFRRDLPGIHDNASLLKALQKLHEPLQKLGQEQRLELPTYNILPWIESRIQARPMPEIIKEKVEKLK